LAFSRGDSLEDPEETDVIALVSDLVTRFKASGAQVSLEQSEAQGIVMIHPMAVARALENLIGNAVKYGTQAKVSVQALERSIRITVQDDGPGIPADQRDEALKPFSRLDAARNQDRGGGVGLGLAIAHDIARRHGGALELGESKVLGGLKAVLVLMR